MKFYTPYSPPPSKPHPSFPFEIKDYIKDSSTGELVECGTIPIYERIQSYHESTTLTYKLKRLAMGDNSALGLPSDSYGDYTEVPTDLRQILDARKKIIQDFNNLPDDLRKVFNNDFNLFEESVKDGTAERRIYDYTCTVSGQVSPGGASCSSEQVVGGA